MISKFIVCDVQLHPTDPYSCIRSDQTLQYLAFMIVPRLFHKECEKRNDYCKKNNIEFKLPKFKRKEGYIPGTNLFEDNEVKIYLIYFKLDFQGITRQNNGRKRT